MTAVQSAPDLSKYLLALKSSDADAVVISTLVSLNGLNPTASDLNASRIHMYLAQNVAKRSGVTGELARQLVAKWRRMLPSQSPPPAGPASATKPDAAQKASSSSSQSPPAPQAEPSMQQISSKKPLLASIVDSGPLSESASKKAKTCSKSPPPSASKSPPPSTDAQGMEALRGRLQGLFDKVTMLRFFAAFLRQCRSDLFWSIQIWKILRSWSVISSFACTAQMHRFCVSNHGAGRLAHFGSFNSACKQQLLRLCSSLNIQNVRMSHFTILPHLPVFPI
jgi:hypothetical protein